MAKETYEIIKVKPKFPVRNLVKLPNKKIASLDAFGPNYFNTNVKEMSKSYSHPVTGEEISFKEPTTADSILTAGYDFENRAKPQIFDPRWLQAGRIVRTSEGVFVNPPKDESGNPIIDEKTLKNYLNNAKPIKVGKGKIYIVSDSENLTDFSFAEYDSFKTGVQDCDTFAESGLAKVLEHTENTAETLRAIASPKFYKRGVNVWGFDSVKEPALRMASLCSGGYLGRDRLGVSGDYWYDDYYGYAFGVCEARTK